MSKRIAGLTLAILLYVIAPVAVHTVPALGQPGPAAARTCTYRYRYGVPVRAAWIKMTRQPCRFDWKAAIECRYYLIGGGYSDQWFYGAIYHSATYRSYASCPYDPPMLLLHRGYETRYPRKRWIWHNFPH